MLASELLVELDAVGARAVIIPMHEPTGYAAANEYVAGVAADSNGRLVAFCRLNPAVSPVEEARRSFEAGARGIKLHPRAEQFGLTDDGVDDIVAFAHERRLPILIHAGRGIPALGRDVLQFAERYPDARFILAHSAICDLGWVWRELPRHRNVFVDTSWWGAERSADRVRARPAGQPPLGQRPPVHDATVDRHHHHPLRAPGGAFPDAAGGHPRRADGAPPGRRRAARPRAGPRGSRPQAEPAAPPRRRLARARDRPNVSRRQRVRDARAGAARLRRRRREYPSDSTPSGASSSCSTARSASPGRTPKRAPPTIRAFARSCWLRCSR